MDIKIYQSVTIGSGDADSTLLWSTGMKGCPPQVFRVLYEELPCHILQLYNKNCKIWLRQNNSIDLVLTYMDNSIKYKIANNTKRIYCYYILAILCSHVSSSWLNKRLSLAIQDNQNIVYFLHRCCSFFILNIRIQ